MENVADDVRGGPMAAGHFIPEEATVESGVGPLIM